MKMMATHQELLWDSDFFGFPVARLTTVEMSETMLDAAIAKARDSGIRLMYLIVEANDAAMASKMDGVGARLMDRKVTYLMNISSLLNDEPQFAAAIGTATASNTQLEALALQSGQYSRFRLDSRLDSSAFPRLYSEWLRNSLSGAIARKVLVWRSQSDIERGLLTLGEKYGRADIGLLAVDAEVRGQRVGQSLVAAAILQAKIWGYREMQVVTQRDNETACRFYEKCGFKLINEEHIYHLWLD
jgi:dTDP-4-amino-4,6-dideoxy-D-galactose acyltransferase